MDIVKKIFTIIMYVLLGLIFTIIIVGFIGYAIRLFLNGYGRNIAFNSKMEYTAISLQLTFFGIILTLFAMGGAILAFVGWKEIKESIKNTSIKNCKDFFESDEFKTLLNNQIETIYLVEEEAMTTELTNGQKNDGHTTPHSAPKTPNKIKIKNKKDKQTVL